MRHLSLLVVGLVLGCGGFPRPEAPFDSPREPGVGTSSRPPREPSVAYIATVTVTLRNATARQATFYSWGGGREATVQLYETHWLPAGSSITLPDAMSGPAGAHLGLGALVTAEGLLRREYAGEVVLTAPQHSCTLTLSEVDYVAVVSQECR